MTLTTLTRPYEILVRIGRDTNGQKTFAAHQRSITEILDGPAVVTAREGDALPLVVADVAAVLGGELPAALLEKDAACAALAAVTAERDAALSEVAAAAEANAALEARLAEVTAPPAVTLRRVIAKSVVQERANALGKLDAAFAILQSQPIMFGRWFAPDWPNVYFDDEGLLAILAAVGCTPEEVAFVTGA
jgi:hypothetical protein